MSCPPKTVFAATCGLLVTRARSSNSRPSSRAARRANGPGGRSLMTSLVAASCADRRNAGHFFLAGRVARTGLQRPEAVIPKTQSRALQPSDRDFGKRRRVFQFGVQNTASLHFIGSRNLTTGDGEHHLRARRSVYLLRLSQLFHLHYVTIARRHNRVPDDVSRIWNDLPLLYIKLVHRIRAVSSSSLDSAVTPQVLPTRFYRVPFQRAIVHRRPGRVTVWHDSIRRRCRHAMSGSNWFESSKSFHPQCHKGSIRTLCIVSPIPAVGIEPTRGYPQRILSPQRLPFRHAGTVLIVIFPSARCNILVRQQIQQAFALRGLSGRHRVKHWDVRRYGGPTVTMIQSSCHKSKQ